MDRKDFIKTCSFACMGLVLASCGGSKMINGTLEGADLIIPLTDFENVKKGVKTYRNYLVVQHEKLQFPVCVYRNSETTYSAVLMRCPHQGAELQVFGDKLQCPAHGSEFDHNGVVQNGPADTNLRTFPVTIENQQLKISLK